MRNARVACHTRAVTATVGRCRGTSYFPCLFLCTARRVRRGCKKSLSPCGKRTAWLRVKHQRLTNCETSWSPWGSRTCWLDLQHQLNIRKNAVYWYYRCSFLCLIGCFSMIVWTPTAFECLLCMRFCFFFVFCFCLFVFVCFFVFAPVQRNWACFTWKGALEIRSLLLLLKCVSMRKAFLHEAEGKGCCL